MPSRACATTVYVTAYGRYYHTSRKCVSERRARTGSRALPFDCMGVAEAAVSRVPCRKCCGKGIAQTMPSTSSRRGALGVRASNSSRTARVVEAQRRYHAGSKYRWRLTVREAARRGIHMGLEAAYALALMDRACVYCGREPTARASGLDRVDNDIGYRRTNVVACCWDCNRMKGTASARDFVVACARIARSEADDAGPACEAAFDDDDTRRGACYAKYRHRARRLGLCFAVDRARFDTLTTRAACVYCRRPAEPDRPLGLDRVDNDGGYTRANIAPCCPRCNHMKGTLDAKAFVAVCARVEARWGAHADRADLNMAVVDGLATTALEHVRGHRALSTRRVRPRVGARVQDRHCRHPLKIKTQ
ncbi:hypothetical protein pmac_cds_233 [Pandoravirus macleodensis]|uniref:HNH nuclease domain-containing protein n=1 Tax=Pandoravirus macleodensis TaxID=2107707 RepID=A0A2U7UEM0_9VIRU|nr:hypothetical protein pmac_cds_233 [Pandoravirus macleodensis]AVK76921.1 hypothetical protein pmac_cds_233 [Pandoravirus macleodensis]